MVERMRVQHAGSATGVEVVYSRDYDALERENKELRTWRVQASDCISRLTLEREAARAENAQLKALPLKDEVERVLERIAAGMEVTLHTGEKAWVDRDDAGEMARALLSRLLAGEQEGWREIEEVPDNKQGPFLVTNNPKAVNAFNRPSHVWCVGSIHVDDDGGFCAFNGYQKIHGLKLYMPVPLPAAPSEQGGDRG